MLALMIALVGNHTAVERICQYNPTALLYAPHRPDITDRGSDTTHFTIEQPSAIVSLLGDERIADAGVELDRKASELLAHPRHAGAAVAREIA
jgi:hypothetical protein